jgi:putative transcriptional regulator
MRRAAKEALEFARDLHQAGAVDKITMREIERLCLPPLPTLTAEAIRRIRDKAQMSQAAFADYLNVGTSTVAQWEQGKKKPSGASVRLLDLIDRKGIEVLA